MKALTYTHERDNPWRELNRGVGRVGTGRGSASMNPHLERSLLHVLRRLALSHEAFIETPVKLTVAAESLSPAICSLVVRSRTA